MITLGYDRPTNPGNLLGFEALRAEEFAAYDEFGPWQKVLVDGDEYFLNFDATEGPEAIDGIVHTDGNDRLFGDLGNDWIVGGTGRDRAYGGYGNDLLNMDDDLETNGGANDAPDGRAALLRGHRLRRPPAATSRSPTPAATA